MKRQLLGIFAAIAAYVAVEMATRPLGPVAGRHLSAGLYLWSLAGLSAVAYFSAMFAGAWTARVRFLAVSALLWFLSTSLVLVWGYRLQVAALPMSVAEFISNQLPTVSLTLLGALLGAWAGQKMARIRRQTPNNSVRSFPSTPSA